jgi:hypothetical protein
VSTGFAEVEFLDVSLRIQVSLFERGRGRHRRELFNQTAGGTLNVDLAAVGYWIVVDPREVDGVFQALLNCVSTVKMMLVAPLLVPVLYVISI